MTSREQLIYEVNLEVDPEALRDYDPWLEDHVREMLEIPGFMSAEILHIEPDADEPDAWPRRSVRYVVASREALDDYLRDHAPRMRAAGDVQFAGRYRASRRVLEEKDRILPDKSVLVQCPNCETPLNGQYCWNCGQRSRVKLITLRELLGDALGDLFELDSRLWRSLVPLVFRPGRLTHDYLEGRRARYMPPFRMYLVISILFFLVWKMSSGGIDFGDETEDAVEAMNSELVEMEERQAASPDPERQKDIEALRQAIAAVEDVSENGGTQTINIGGIRVTNDGGEEELDAVSGASPDVESDDDIALPAPAADTGTSDDGGWDCEGMEIDDDIPWFVKLIGRDQIVETCKKMARDKGVRWGKAMFDNLPAMMFLFLPLLALALKTLYLGSGRYYVEHLLFTVHYHAFFFLVVTITVLVHQFQETLHLPTWMVGIYTAVVVLYIQPVYLYKALRRVYHQGHIVTSLKWLILSVAYLAALVLTMILGAVITALTFD